MQAFHRILIQQNKRKHKKVTKPKHQNKFYKYEKRKPKKYT